MKTTMQEIMEKALIGKTLMCDGQHVFNLKIVDVIMNSGYDGETTIKMEKGATTDIYPGTPIEVI